MEKTSLPGKPVISVIIPVYNVEKYLRRCLDSVLASTYENLEIICVNDGSTDGSPAILREYARKDARVLAIDQPNKKLSAARNAGMDAATGDFYAFIDSDDWVHPLYFEALLDGHRRTGADIALCEALVTGGSVPDGSAVCGEEIPVTPLPLAELETMQLEKSRAWGKLYTRAIVGNRRFESGTEPVEDMVFNLPFLNRETRFCLVREKLYYYFMREDSAVHVQEGRSRLKTAFFLLDQYPTAVNPEMRRRIVEQCCKIAFSCRYLEMFSPDYAEILGQCRALLERLHPLFGALTMKERVAFAILERCPLLYRLFRIANDPTMLRWERNKRRAS